MPAPHACTDFARWPAPSICSPPRSSTRAGRLSRRVGGAQTAFLRRSRRPGRRDRPRGDRRRGRPRQVRPQYPSAAELHLQHHAFALLDQSRRGPARMVLEPGRLAQAARRYLADGLSRHGPWAPPRPSCCVSSARPISSRAGGCALLCRRFMEFCRTVPEIVFALLFVVAFGLVRCPACWRSPSIPRARSASCSPRRWKTST